MSWIFCLGTVILLLMKSAQAAEYSLATTMREVARAVKLHTIAGVEIGLREGCLGLA
jgi:hypothetical protein